MKMQYIAPLMMAFLMSIILGPLLIPFLKRVKAGQVVRDDGPRSHLKKNGTPTMGGILILFAILPVVLYYYRDFPEILPVFFLTAGFGMVGFTDDYLKIILARSMGLSPLQKLALQVVVTLLYAILLCRLQGGIPDMLIPFAKEGFLRGIFAEGVVRLGKKALPALLFIALACANGVNLTDGLDGLAGSVTVITATFLTVVAVGRGSGIAPFTCAVTGALLGFLIFNVYPASVFMGDTGSLALGGFLVGSAYALKLPLFIPLIGFVYMAEVISVILQVAYFKLSGGKRLLKMAPLHHHLELSGLSEPRIVAVFSILTAILCLLGLKGI